MYCHCSQPAYLVVDLVAEQECYWRLLLDVLLGYGDKVAVLLGYGDEVAMILEEDGLGRYSKALS